MSDDEDLRLDKSLMADNDDDHASSTKSNNHGGSSTLKHSENGSRDRSRSKSPRSKKSDKPKSSGSDRKRRSSSRDKERSRDKDSDKRKDSKDKKDDDKDKDKDRRRSPRRSSKKSPRRKSRSRSRGRSSRSSRSSRKKSRSRSRSRSSRRSRRHSRSSSRSRSRSRSKKRSKPSMFNAAAVTSTINAVNALTSQIGTSPAAVQQMLASQMQAANPQLTRQARRLYVGNLPVGMGLNEKMLAEFFNATVQSFGITTPSPVLSTWLSSEGTFCFVEFRAVQDATACLTLLQGISLGGRSLRVGRPADYKVPPPSLENYIVGMEGNAIKPGDTPAMPGIGGFGGLNLPGVQYPAGSAPSGTAPNFSGLLAGLPSFPTGTAPGPAAGNVGTINPMRLAQMGAGGALSAPASAPKLPPTKVLLLLNMVTAAELVDDEEFGDIVLDVREECEKFGPVVKIVIPRPKKDTGDVKLKEGSALEGADEGPPTGIGVGRIFVLYKDTESTTKAVEALNGRMFNNNKVEASYYNEDKYASRVFV